MADGSARPIEDLVPGDATAGGTIKAALQFHYRASAQLYTYQGVTVTGDHAVAEPGGRFVRVCRAVGAMAVPDSDLAFGGSVGGTPTSDVLYDIITTDHRIFVFAQCSGPSVAGRVVEFADYVEADEGLDEERERRLALLNVSQSASRPLPAVVTRARDCREVRCHSPLRRTSYGGAAGLPDT
jgi:hypothetical protein